MGRFQCPIEVGEVAVVAVQHGKGQYRLGQRILVGSSNDCVALRATRLANEPAGMALGELILLPNLRSLPAPFGAYKFPEMMSFNTCFSRDRSATSR